jgi:hypothetical protein
LLAASPVELLVDADGEASELVPIGLRDAVAAAVRPFGGDLLQFYRRSEFSGGELLPQLLDLRAIQERGIGGDGCVQFGRGLTYIVDGGVDDRRVPSEIGRDGGIGGQRFSNGVRRFRVATEQMLHPCERVERVRHQRLAPVRAQRVVIRDARAADERRIFAGDDGCALGDWQRLFGIVSINRERVREVVEGERIVGAVGQELVKSSAVQRAGSSN